MKKAGKMIGLGALVAAGALVAVFMCRENTAVVDEASPHAAARPAKKDVIKGKGLRGMKAVGGLKAKDRAKDAQKKDFRAKRRPVTDQDTDLSHLGAEQRTTLNNLQSALDDDNFEAVLALAQKVQSSKDWPDGIPIELRKEVLNALSWFGIKALPEITGFLADADSDIVEEAVSAYENLMSDANGDAELAQAVLAAARTINDVDAMETILSELNNMRNSVAVDTIKKIMSSGTEAAKNALQEAIDFFTGEEGISTPEQLDKWYNDPSGDNLDDENAEEMYGPQA